MGNDIQVLDAPSNELLPISSGQVKAQVQAIQQLMKDVMKDKEHYGTIPGCGPKPTLLKAGAEKLAFMFRLAPRYDVTVHELDGGHFRYELKCRLESLITGRTIAEGVGCCSSLETKYAYAGKDNDGNKLPRTNLEDVRNTVEKMAAKRALVAAVLNGTAASDIFTQDLEEIAEVIGETATDTMQAPPPPQAARKSAGTNGVHAKLWEACLQAAGGDEEEARNVLETMTSFQTEDGKTIKGKRDVSGLSEKWAASSLKRITHS